MVVGRGDIPADLLFIGEAPGKSEDILGEAFIGAAGKLLEIMLKRAGLQSCKKYITNCILCRPCEGRGTDNRQPKSEEVLACRKNIFTIIRFVNPRQVIFIGQVAKKYFGRDFPNALTITHPAALLREGGQASPSFLHNIRILEGVKK